MLPSIVENQQNQTPMLFYTLKGGMWAPPKVPRRSPEGPPKVPRRSPKGFSRPISSFSRFRYKNASGTLLSETVLTGCVWRRFLCDNTST